MWCSIMILSFLCAKGEDVSTVVDDNDVQGDTTIEVDADVTDEQYDESDKAWIREALVNVAYYLRSHKFNEYDRRFYKVRPDEQIPNMYKQFPEPPLRHFHWDVFSHCKSDFETCLRYLYETVVDASWQYSTDTISIIRRRKLDLEKDKNTITLLEEECQEDIKANETEPFRGPLERFQWRTTASYFMCQFTMQEEPQLQFFYEPCDNLANCLQGNKQLSNSDIRAKDAIPFACALYSFCPDPCCPEVRVAINIQNCLSNKSGNPCSKLSDSTCSLNKSINVDLASIVYNEWNVSCNCPEGASWSSRYRMCIQYDKCHTRESGCDQETQDCWNNRNETMCNCKFGYKIAAKDSQKCKRNSVLVKALQLFDGTYDENKAGQLNFNLDVTIFSTATILAFLLL